MLLLTDVVVPEERRLALGDADACLDRALDLATTGAVAEGLGGALTLLSMTVEHLRTREQFGQPIGRFQALQHRAAQMFIECELLRFSSLQAMVRATDEDPNVRRAAVSAAKAQLAESAGYVARQSIQLHGGLDRVDQVDAGADAALPGVLLRRGCAPGANAGTGASTAPVPAQEPAHGA